MKTAKLLLSLGIIALLLGIVLPTRKNVSDVSKDTITENDTVIINIQPLDGIKNVDNMATDFKKYYLVPLGMDNYKINILPHKDTPDSAYNKAHTRFRATKVLNYLHDNTPVREFTIGITDKDLSTSIHGSDDYGILGIAFLGNDKRACITSTYRLKFKKDLWKLVAHEFTHGFFGAGHCDMDDSYCIMQDAKGKSPKFEDKGYLCASCWRKIDKKLNPSIYE